MSSSGFYPMVWAQIILLFQLQKNKGKKCIKTCFLVVTLEESKATFRPTSFIEVQLVILTARKVLILNRPWSVYFHFGRLSNLVQTEKLKKELFDLSRMKTLVQKSVPFQYSRILLIFKPLVSCQIFWIYLNKQQHRNNSKLAVQSPGSGLVKFGKTPLTDQTSF